MDLILSPPPLHMSITSITPHTPSLIIHVPSPTGGDQLHRVTRIYTQPHRSSHLTLCLTCHRAYCAVCAEGIGGFWWHHLFCDRVASQESHAWRTSSAAYIVTRLDLAEIPPLITGPPVATQPGPLALGHRSPPGLRGPTTSIKASLLERLPSDWYQSNSLKDGGGSAISSSYSSAPGPRLHSGSMQDAEVPPTPVGTHTASPSHLPLSDPAQPGRGKSQRSV